MRPPRRDFWSNASSFAKGEEKTTKDQQKEEQKDGHSSALNRTAP
jgi:hypothetical protein